MKHLSLFSGIGGLDIAAEWAGFETVGQCEYADYPTRVLEKHWPDVPRWRDIHDLSADNFYRRTGMGPGELTCISGGFPCQPFSVAGKQKGKGDDRYLWPAMLRVITDLKPRFVVGENVPGILRIAGKTVCEDLEHAGYSVTVFDLEAASVGAPHRRARIFFVAHSNNEGCSDGAGYQAARSKEVSEFKRSGGGYVSNPNSTDGKRGGASKIKAREPQLADLYSQAGGGWAIEPQLGRVAHGIPHRVDRLRCLGNAVVPQQAYPIYRAIAMVEEEITREDNT